MAGWLEVLVAAATLQLLVLPGEKVQLIIAGLSTKYNPYIVVAGAGVAFAGWTALEIVFGEALQRALPAVYLDAITGGLFLLFGVVLAYTALGLDESGDGVTTDGSGEYGGQDASAEGTALPGPQTEAITERVPEGYRGFVPAFTISAFGEFGDKTQLVTIGLAVQYGAHPAIWLGEMLVIIPVSLATALVSHRLSHLITVERRRYVYLGSAALFFLFAADTAAEYVFGGGFLPV
ncbi:TMEM165/GDT1 family protein [Haloglomus litoreum]|uniref:TMEM165/GDT1 family protein n=1 Tax=Haloglomus litoreum TaxID=3034026 RepID=UPI0023E8C110|nr:TMEM165/GDT1 family protein [Haloglomus sp. DT116]